MYPWISFPYRKRRNHVLGKFHYRRGNFHAINKNCCHRYLYRSAVGYILFSKLAPNTNISVLGCVYENGQKTVSSPRWNKHDWFLFFFSWSGRRSVKLNKRNQMKLCARTIFQPFSLNHACSFLTVTIPSDDYIGWQFNMFAINISLLSRPQSFVTFIFYMFLLGIKMTRYLRNLIHTKIIVNILSIYIS